MFWVLPVLTSCQNNPSMLSASDPKKTEIPVTSDTATFGMGCFWCTEAVFLQLKGVVSAASGYSGGKTHNPTYREVSSGQTGHAEVCQVVFDTSQISFTELLEVFWTAHDPTTLNRQGADHGTQYRSVVFYHNESQKRIAEDYRHRLNLENAFPDPVITEISPIATFYIAEDYHLDYYARNQEAPYCQVVILPKVDKVRKVFSDKIKR